MLLRETTSSAFAPSFKRFARCAVAGLALAGLAACGGGGGSSTPAATAPTTPTPTPATPTPCPQGQVRVDGQCRAEIPIQRQLNEYGSLAFAMNPWGAAGSVVTTSQTAARDRAVAACENFCTSSSSCGCREVLRVRNACGSLAYSIDNSRAGVGWGETESAAGESAIARCHAAGGQSCRVATSSTGSLSTFCAKAGSATPSGEASTIPARPASQQQQPTPSPSPAPSPAATTYGALYFGQVEVSRNNWSSSWSFGSGTSASAAERDAERNCESGFQGSCESALSGYANACGAIAVSECTGQCVQPAFAFGADRLRSEAEAEAVRECETAVVRSPPDIGTCRVATGRERHTRELTPGVLCVGTAAQR